MTPTPVVVSLFLFGRAYSLNFLPLFSSLNPYSDYVGSTFHQTLSRSVSLTFMLPLFALLRWIAEPTPSPLLFFPSEIFSICGISIPITPSGTQKVLLTPMGRDYSIASSLPFSALTFLPFSIALLVTSSLLLLFYPWKVLQDLSSDHLSILVTVPLSLLFHRNKRSPSYNIQKARWDDFDSH